MGFLNRKIVIMALSTFMFSCAQLLPPGPQAPVVSDQKNSDGSDTDDGQNLVLAGVFKKSDGETVQFKEFADQPTVVIFAGEFCSACRKETEHLVALFADKGLPSNIKILTVLVGSTHEDITGWVDTFEAGKPTWLIAADDDEITFYKKYFSKLVTPSILYIDPATKKIKKFQEAITIEKLQEETQPWY